MARRPRATDETLIELFLDMLAAERGASSNTLDAYRRDLADLRRHLAQPAARRRGRQRRRCARYLGELAERGLATAVGGAAAVGDPPALSLPLRRRPSRATIRPR